MIVPINEQLKKLRDERGIDIQDVTWPGILDELRIANPSWQPGQDELDQWQWYGVPNNMNVAMVWFNRSMYQKVANELGPAMPPEPWLNWTWWDYLRIGRALQQRGEQGNILSFGCMPPNVALLYLQIGHSMRGDDRAAFDALTTAERAERNLGDLSWDDCTRIFKPRGDGTYELFPNRIALHQAMQLQHDPRHVIAAVPTASDQKQVAQIGGFGGQGGQGQFRSGTLGMLIEGRWFLGQVRNDTNFDWRLLRIPRWASGHEVWADWEARGLSHRRTGRPLGRSRHGRHAHCAATPTTVASRKLGHITKTAADHGRVDESFRFLEFLLTNEDFNHVLLIEDGMGANVATAKEYLAQPGPVIPGRA